MTKFLGLEVRGHVQSLLRNLCVLSASIITGVLYYSLKVVWVDSAM